MLYALYVYMHLVLLHTWFFRHYEDEIGSKFYIILLMLSLENVLANNRCSVVILMYKVREDCNKIK